MFEGATLGSRLRKPDAITVAEKTPEKTAATEQAQGACDSVEWLLWSPQ